MELVLVESIIKLQEREKWEMKQEKWLKVERQSNESCHISPIYTLEIFSADM